MTTSCARWLWAYTRKIAVAYRPHLGEELSASAVPSM